MSKVIILAAGQGTRLKPLTDDKPKCLVKLFNKTILDHQIDVYKKYGFNNIHIVTGYCSDKIEALGYNTTINSNYESTNMVASLFAAKEFLLSSSKEDLVISYGDIVFQKKNLEKLVSNDSDVSIMNDKNWEEYWKLRMPNPLEDAETFILDNNNYIKELGKKPDNYDRIQGQFTGLIKVDKNKIVELIEIYNSLDKNVTYDGKDFDNMYMTSFIQLLINYGWRVQAVDVYNGWLEIDTTNDLLLYEKLNNEGKLFSYYQF